jgi:hypothetical protein
MSKNKKPWRYMAVKAAVDEDGKEYPPTKARKQFKLPWGVTDKGLKNTAARQASNILKLMVFVLALCACPDRTTRPARGRDFMRRHN